MPSLNTDILSLVNFDKPRRADYLAKSFGDFYKFNTPRHHIVMDSSQNIGAQLKYYEKYGVDWHHCPGMTYSDRLREGLRQVQSDYFLFFPDDFRWIFDFPLEQAIAELRTHSVQVLKLGCRGMAWFSNPSPQPAAWYTGNQVISGEILVPMGNLRVSKRRWFRDFHEQFSLGCNVMQTSFANWVFAKIPSSVVAAGQAEKWAYLHLLRRRYQVAYFKMWTPAFHFIDLEIEGESPKNLEKAQTNLIDSNIELYNRLFHST